MRKKHRAIIQLLIENGASARKGGLSLHDLDFDKDDDLMRGLLAADVDVDALKDGYTALFPATRGGMQTTVQFLLESGANVHIKTEDGRHALQEASVNGGTEMVQILLAYANVSDDDSSSLLQTAMKLENGDVEIPKTQE